MRWIGLLLLALVASCKTTQPQMASIALNPAQAARGETVKISLTGLSADGARVFLNTTELPLQKLDAQNLSVVLPKDAPAGPQTVQVQSGNTLASAPLGVLGDVVADQLVVTLKPGVSPADAQKQIRALGFTFIQEPQPLDPKETDPNSPCSGSLGVISVNGKPLGEALAELEKLDIVYKADPQMAGGAGAVDYLGAIGAAGVKQRNLSGNGITIAVLDTGVSATPVTGVRPGAVVAGDTVNLLPGYNFVGNSTNVTDDFTQTDPVTQAVTLYHGTPIAVLAAGAKLGVASQALVLPVKVCDKAGLCLASNVVKGVCYALSQVTDRSKLVLSLSLGGDTPVSVLEAILGYALGKNTLIAAAGGNQGPDIRDGSLVKLTPKHYPAAYKLPGLVAVAALANVSTGPTPVWQPAPFSSRGANIDYLDIAAPGQDILIGNYTYQGTSFATPLVAGALAMWREKYPALSPADIEAKLKAAATPLPPYTVNDVGAGLLNLSSAP